MAFKKEYWFSKKVCICESVNFSYLAAVSAQQARICVKPNFLLRGVRHAAKLAKECFYKFI